MEDSGQDGFYEYARKLITYKAWQLIGKYGLTHDDYKDLQQDLFLDLLQRMPKFDPSKASRNTFIARVVDHKIFTIIRYRKQEMRNYQRRGPSLDAPIEGSEGDTRVDLVSQDDLDLQTGRHTRSEIERIDFRVDVARVLSGLPPDLKPVAERLQSQSVTEVARDLGVPRATLYGWIARLRTIFENRGLRDYL